MGAADVVPGVSGGTIAFITGIYDELIESIRACNLHALKLCHREGVAAAWQYIHGNFLLSLLLGIAVSVFSLARLVSHALEFYPIPLFSLFFGLILASALVVFRHIPRRQLGHYAWLLLGCGFALFLGELRPAEIPVNQLTVFLAGSVAICAMILPGISGSFILLLLGMYTPVIHAIKTLDFSLLTFFAVGCGCGLLLFVRFLSWLMHRHREPLLACLSGILLGSLSIIWPWKIPSDDVLSTNTSPWHYAEILGSPLLIPAVLLALVGSVLVLVLEKQGQNGEVS